MAVSITMEAAFYVETLEDALARRGRPEIFNTDQGSQFTGSAFTDVLADNAIAISMVGKRGLAGSSNEEVYLRAYETVGEARNSIGRYLAPQIKPTSTRCHSAWQPSPAEAPLIDAESLFRQPGPAQT